VKPVYINIFDNIWKWHPVTACLIRLSVRCKYVFPSCSPKLVIIYLTTLLFYIPSWGISLRDIHHYYYYYYCHYYYYYYYYYRYYVIILLCVICVAKGI
jgi:hypothetical protein